MFGVKKGFDIVIGNPPYMRVQGIEKKVSKEYKSIFQSSTGSYDLYVLFTEIGLNLLKSNCHHSVFDFQFSKNHHPTNFLNSALTLN
jgi:methylase of polypeptide subunit release factors